MLAVCMFYFITINITRNRSLKWRSIQVEKQQCFVIGYKEEWWLTEWWTTEWLWLSDKLFCASQFHCTILVTCFVSKGIRFLRCLWSFTVYGTTRSMRASKFLNMVSISFLTPSKTPHAYTNYLQTLKTLTNKQTKQKKYLNMIPSVCNTQVWSLYSFGCHH